MRAYLSALFAKRHWRSDVGWPTVLWCRWRGHPHGMIWFHPGANAPDTRCKVCGDDLG